MWQDYWHCSTNWLGEVFKKLFIWTFHHKRWVFIDSKVPHRNKGRWAWLCIALFEWVHSTPLWPKPFLSFSQLPDVRGLSVHIVTINQPFVTYDIKKHKKHSFFLANCYCKFFWQIHFGRHNRRAEQKVWASGDFISIFIFQELLLGFGGVFLRFFLDDGLLAHFVNTHYTFHTFA